MLHSDLCEATSIKQESNTTAKSTTAAEEKSVHPLTILKTSLRIKLVSVHVVEGLE